MGTFQIRPCTFQWPKISVAMKRIPLYNNYRLKNLISALNSQGNNFTIKNFEKKVVLLGVKGGYSIFLSVIIVKFDIHNNNYGWKNRISILNSQGHLPFQRQVRGRSRHEFWHVLDLKLFAWVTDTISDYYE